MRNLIDDFTEYLQNERNVTQNSILAYLADAHEFYGFLESRGIKDFKDAGEAEAVAFVMELKKEDKAESTIKRKLASLRNFYSYLQSVGKIHKNPIAGIKTPKVERKQIEYLTIEELAKVFELPSKEQKGIRDRAMIELLYATGIRVREFVELRMKDLNLKLGFITCTGEFGKARIIPIGKYARVALEDYIKVARPYFLEKSHCEIGKEGLEESGEENEVLFLNRLGKKMTRQGIWKLLKEYSCLAGLEDKLTPQTLRNSFAAHMIQNGADLKSLQELMGHEDATATQIYLSLTKNRIKDVYDRTHPRA